MIPLPAGAAPRSGRELAAAIEAGVARFTRGGTVRAIAEEESSGWPQLALLQVDLASMEFDAERWPRAAGGAVEASGPSIRVRRLEIRGTELAAAGLAFDLEAHATGAVLRCGGTAAPLLSVEQVGEGRLEASCSREALQRAVRARLAALAAERGVALEEVAVDVADAGGGRLCATVRATARKLVRAHLTAAATLAIDADCTLAVAGVEVEAAGFLGALIGPVLREQARRLEGRRIPLGAFVLAGSRARSVRLAAGERIEVAADFAR